MSTTARTIREAAPIDRQPRDHVVKAWRRETAAITTGLCQRLGLSDEQAAYHGHAVAKYMQRLSSNARATDNLMNAQPVSLHAAILHLILLGLDLGMPDHAALVPFKGSVTPIPMVKGLVHLIARHLRYSPPQVHLVRRGERFEESFGSEGTRLVYVPHRPQDVSAEIVAGFVQCRNAEGLVEVFVVDGAKLRKVEQFALQRAGDRDTPWKSWPDEMRKKTVIRQWASGLPLQPTQHSAWDAIDGREQGKRIAAPEVLTALAEGQLGESEDIESLDADRDETIADEA